MIEQLFESGALTDQDGDDGDRLASALSKVLRDALRF